MADPRRCNPVHEGPFFYHRPGWQRCDACGAHISNVAVVSSARRYLSGDEALAAQVQQSAARVRRAAASNRGG